MRHALFAAAVLAFAPTAPAAFAQSAGDENYQMERVGEDLLRLHKPSGKIELCAKSAPTFVCRTIVEAPEAANDAIPASAEVLAENAALKAQNKALKRRLAMIAALVEGEDLAGAAPASVKISEDPRAQIDEAVAVTGYALRRFRDLVETLND